MSAPTSSTLTPPATTPVAAPEPRVPTAEIDASCRSPLLFFFTCATVWLIAGLVLALIATIKLHGPGFLSGSAWLTLGRIRPAAMNAILYGFASQAAFGVLLWMICRLGRTRLCCQVPLILAGLFWNLGVKLGILGILAGASTGFEWLEMPRFASTLLFVAYTFIGVAAVVTFHFRNERSLYVSQWYLLAALFWFPWIFSAANLLLLYVPVRGVLQSTVNAWFTANFLGLWLVPVGLAAIFYFIPKLSGRPLHSHYLAALGFWTLAFFTNWKGLAQLIGGPLPAWMISSSIAANVLMIVPLIAVAMNWHLTLTGLYGQMKANPTMRFILFGAGAYLVWGLVSLITGLRAVSEITQFTYVSIALNYLVLLGFFAMVVFGAFYYIIPRLLRMELPSACNVRTHFICSAFGITLIFVALTVGGVIQGFRLNHGTADLVSVVKSTVPFVGLSTLGLLSLLAGQVAFLMNLCAALRQCVEPFRKSAVDLVTGVEPAAAGGKS